MGRSPAPSVATLRTSVAVLAAFGVAAVALFWASAGPLAAVGRPGPADLETLTTAAAAIGAWLCLAWLALGFAVAALGTVPTATGRWCAQVSARITPIAVRRLAEITLGVTVTVTVAAGAGLAASASAVADAGSGFAQTTGVPGVLPVGTTHADASSEPGVTVDGGTGEGMPQQGTAPIELPSLDRPAGAASAEPVEAPADAGPSAPETTSAPAPAHLVTSAPRAGRGESARGRPEVVVRRGDSLWAIAARHLGPGASNAAKAAAWPRWYAANRHVIGEDPDLLQPGQLLRPPSPEESGSPKEGR